MQATVLMLGQDPTLLATRKLVLESAGFKVHIALNQEQTWTTLEERYVDLLILGSSLEDEVIREVMRGSSKRSPIKTLILRRDCELSASYLSQVEVLDSMAGPEKLIRAVSDMLRQHSEVTFAPHSYRHS